MKCLSIHLTDLCNSECTFCVVASPLYTKDSIVYEQVLSFLEVHKDAGYHAVNLHGGEPTIHPRFVDTLKYIRQLGYPEVHLQTNGIKLADEAFTRCLFDHRVAKFIVSLHGDLAEYHDSQTFTNGGFVKTIQGIRNVKALGAHVRTNTVITIQNLQRLSGIATLACDLGVDHINFSNLHPVGSARFSRGRIMPRFEHIREWLYPAIDVVLARGRRVTLEGFPFCTIGGGYERLHLTKEYREIKMLIRGQVLADYDTFMRVDMSVFGGPCTRCPARSACGGVYPEYVEYNGWDEFDPSLAPSGFVERLVDVP
jgi:MoaA/NifB/PqqE/SkfB family radical SAM enzyme